MWTCPKSSPARYSVRCWTMTNYDAADDILVLHLSDKPVASEMSQDWNLNITYADNGNIVEIVILDAKASGAWPIPQHAT